MPTSLHFFPLVRLAGLAVATLLLVSCANDDLTLAERKAAKTLGKMGAARAEYGSITMSQPLLIHNDGDASPFAFEPGLKAADLYNAARTDEEGAAMIAASEQMATALGLTFAADLPTMRNYDIALDDFQRQRAGYARGQDLRREKLRAQYELDRAEAESADTEAEKKRLLAKARTDYLQGLIDLEPATASTPPVPDDSRVPEPPASGPAAKTDALSAMQAPGALISGHTPKLPVRTALVTASGDAAIQGIFQVLGDPGKYTKFKGKKIALAVATVSVEPGSRTREGYIGEVIVETYFHLDRARDELIAKYQPAKPAITPPVIKPGTGSEAATGGVYHIMGSGAGSVGNTQGSAPADSASVPSKILKWSAAHSQGNSPMHVTKNRLDSQPLVEAVSPLMDAQTMNLGSSFRQQQSFALQIAAALKGAGYKAGANFFSSWAKNLQSDFATKSSLPVITTFNVGGGVFGFRVGPRLKALQEPGGKSVKPSKEIERQSFPVLLVIGLEEEDLRLVEVDGDETKHTEFGGKKYSEPTLGFTQSGTWYAADAGLMPLRATAFPTEIDRLRWNRALYRLAKDSNNALDEGSDSNGGTQHTNEDALGMMTRHRAETLQMQLLGATSYSSLPIDFFPVVEEPKPEVPAVTDVMPNMIKFDPADQARKILVVIKGANLAGVSEVRLGTEKVDKFTPGKGAVLAEFTLPAGFKGGARNFALSFKDQSTPVFTPVVTFEAWKQAPPPETLTLTHTRNATTKSDGVNVVTETYEAPAGSEALIHKYLESHKAAGDSKSSSASVNVDIQATQEPKK